MKAQQDRRGQLKDWRAMGRMVLLFVLGVVLAGCHLGYQAEGILHLPQGEPLVFPERLWQQKVRERLLSREGQRRFRHRLARWLFGQGGRLRGVLQVRFWPGGRQFVLSYKSSDREETEQVARRGMLLLHQELSALWVGEFKRRERVLVGRLRESMLKGDRLLKQWQELAKKRGGVRMGQPRREDRRGRKKPRSIQRQEISLLLRKNRKVLDHLRLRLKETRLKMAKSSRGAWGEERGKPILMKSSWSWSGRWVLLFVCVFGVCFAVVWILWERHRWSRGGLERWWRLPLLGKIPLLRKEGRRESPELYSYVEPQSGLAVRYRELSSQLILRLSPSQPRQILVTSATRGEGKTTTLLNLGIAFAQGGHSTVLVDADFCCPRLHRTFGLSNIHGLSTIMARQSSLEEALVQTEIAGLSIIPSGPLPPEPTILLEGAGLEQMLLELSRRFERVLVDGGSLLSCTGVPFLASRVGKVLFVVGYRQARWGQLRKARSQLQEGAFSSLGFVVNGCEGEDEYYYPAYERSGLLLEEELLGSSPLFQGEK